MRILQGGYKETAAMEFMPISGTTRPDFAKFAVMEAQPSFDGIIISYELLVNDVMFSYNGAYGSMTLPQQPYCNILYGHKKLVAFCSRRRWLQRLDKSCAGCQGGV